MENIFFTKGSYHHVTKGSQCSLISMNSILRFHLLVLLYITWGLFLLYFPTFEVSFSSFHYSSLNIARFGLGFFFKLLKTSASTKLHFDCLEFVRFMEIMVCTYGYNSFSIHIQELLFLQT